MAVPTALHPAFCDVPYAAHMEPFLLRVAELVCDVFGSECAKRFEWRDSGHSNFSILLGELDSLHRVKMTVSKEATVVIFYRNDKPVEEFSRMTLRNNSWTDFVGWISQVKTNYDNITKQYRIYEVTQRIGLLDEKKNIPVHFHKGNQVQISADLTRIRSVGSVVWTQPAWGDKISSITRAIEKGWFVKVLKGFG